MLLTRGLTAKRRGTGTDTGWPSSPERRRVGLAMGLGSWRDPSQTGTLFKMKFIFQLFSCRSESSKY